MASWLTAIAALTSRSSLLMPSTIVDVHRHHHAHPHPCRSIRYQPRQIHAPSRRPSLPRYHPNTDRHILNAPSGQLTRAHRPLTRGDGATLWVLSISVGGLPSAPLGLTPFHPKVVAVSFRTRSLGSWNNRITSMLNSHRRRFLHGADIPSPTSLRAPRRCVSVLSHVSSTLFLQE